MEVSLKTLQGLYFLSNAEIRTWLLLVNIAGEKNEEIFTTITELAAASREHKRISRRSLGSAIQQLDRLGVIQTKRVGSGLRIKIRTDGE